MIQNSKEEVMIRSFRNGWIPVLLLVALSSSFLNVPLPRGNGRPKRQRPPKRPRNQNQPKVLSLPKPQQVTQSALQCDAQSALLMDGLTGEVLYEQNPRLRIPPASFVKVMTLYVAFDAIRADN